MSECPPVLIGEKVWWLGSGSGLPKKGVIRWIGKLPEISSDWAIGIELEERLPYGGVDGRWRGRDLFKCKKNHGLLVPSDRVVAKGGSGGLCREDAERLAKVVDKEREEDNRVQQRLLLDRHEDFASVHREAVRLRKERLVADALQEGVGEEDVTLPRIRRQTDDDSSADRKQKTHSGIFSFFRWFRKDSVRVEERCLSNPSSPVLRRAESSYLGSVDTLFSTATATSFSYVRPWPRVSRQVSNQPSPPVQPPVSSGISLREKYNLYASGSLALSLDDLRSNYGTLTLRKRRAPQPPTESLPTTLNKETEGDRLHRRTVSECAQYRKPSYIKGKRRAPPPPEENSNPTDPSKSESTTSNHPEKSPRVLRTSYSEETPSTSKQSPSVLRSSKSFRETSEEPGANTLRRKRKAPPPPLEVSGEAGLKAIDESKRETDGEVSDTFSTDTLRLEKGVLKPAMERQYADTTVVPTSPVSPRPWYKRGTSTEPKEAKKPKDNSKRCALEDKMLESGFPRRSAGLNLFGKDSEEKRRSACGGLSLLANISQLDREAAEIVRLRSRDKFFCDGTCQTEPVPSNPSSGASTKELISLFNSITGTARVTEVQPQVHQNHNKIKLQSTGATIPDVAKIVSDAQSKTSPAKETSSAVLDVEEARGTEKVISEVKPANQHRRGSDSSSGSSSSFKVWSGASAVSRKLVVWVCPRCTLENARWRLTCEACDMWRPPMADYNASKTSGNITASSATQPAAKVEVKPSTTETKAVPSLPSTSIDRDISERISTSQVLTMSRLKEPTKPLYPKLDEMINLDREGQPSLAKDKEIDVPIKLQEVRTARLAYFDKSKNQPSENAEVQTVNCLGESFQTAGSEKLKLRDLLKHMKDTLPRQKNLEQEEKPTNIKQEKVIPIQLSNGVEKKPKSFLFPMETSFDSKPISKLSAKESFVPAKTESYPGHSRTNISNNLKKLDSLVENSTGSSKAINNVPIKVESVVKNGAPSQLHKKNVDKEPTNHINKNGLVNGLSKSVHLEKEIPIKVENSNNVHSTKHTGINIPIEMEHPVKKSNDSSGPTKKTVLSNGIGDPQNSTSEIGIPVRQGLDINTENYIPIRPERGHHKSVKSEINIPIRHTKVVEGPKKNLNIETVIPIRQETVSNGLPAQEIKAEISIPIRQNKLKDDSQKSMASNIKSSLSNDILQKKADVGINIPIRQEKSPDEPPRNAVTEPKSIETPVNGTQCSVEINIPITQEKAADNSPASSSKPNTIKTEVSIPIQKDVGAHVYGEGSSNNKPAEKVVTNIPIQIEDKENSATGYFVTTETTLEEIIKPGKVSSSAQTSSRVLKEPVPEETVIPVMVEEYSSQEPLAAGKNVPKEQPAARSHELYLNTMALNRLLRRLEAAIAGGQLDLAADLAKELALMRISCSVIRQRHQPTDIMLQVQVEGKAGECRQLSVRAKPWLRLGDLASRVEREHGLPRQQQRWIVNRRLVDDPRSTLASLGIVANTKVFLYLVESVGEGYANPLTSPISPQSPDPLKQEQEPAGTSYFASSSRPPPGPSRPSQSPMAQTPTSPLVQSPTFPIGPLPLVEFPMSPEPVEGWKCSTCMFMNSDDKIGCSTCSSSRQPITKNGVTIVEEVENGHYEKLLELDKKELVISSIEFECPVCLTVFPPNNGIVLRECLHTFCRSCLADVVKYSEEAEVKCPYRDVEYTCNGILLEREIKALVAEEVYEDHLAKSVALAESRIANAFHCKTADCVGWCIYEDNVNTFTCPVCSCTNCLTCQAIHTGMNCKEYQEHLANSSSSSQEAKRTAEMLQDMVRRGEAMECPTCKVILMKKWGCDWLRCSVCRTEICWITRGPRWGPAGKGDVSGGCKCGVFGVRCHPKCTYCH